MWEISRKIAFSWTHSITVYSRHCLMSLLLLLHRNIYSSCQWNFSHSSLIAPADKWHFILFESKTKILSSRFLLPASWLVESSRQSNVNEWFHRCCEWNRPTQEAEVGERGKKINDWEHFFSIIDIVRWLRKENENAEREERKVLFACLCECRN